MRRNETQRRIISTGFALMIVQIVLQLSSYENVVWAWFKLLSYYRHSEVWYDELELANFELRLDKELASLSDDLGSGKCVPIKKDAAGSVRPTLLLRKEL
jgi:hypothetical protein